MAQDIVSAAGARLPIPHSEKKAGKKNMIHSIIKRDGRVVLYDQNKIAAAILRALEASGDGNAADAARVANDVQNDLERHFPQQAPNIEAIQDTVERQLMNHGFTDAAKAYILYRANRTRSREASTTLMKTIDEITNIDARISDMKRDNANIDGNTAMGSGNPTPFRVMPPWLPSPFRATRTTSTAVSPFPTSTMAWLRVLPKLTAKPSPAV